MDKLKLKLSLALPREADDADPCTDRLLANLRGHAGVLEAHLEKQADQPPVLCIHFEPERLAPSALEKLVREAGAALAVRFGHVSVKAPSLRHERQARTIEAALQREQGVLHAAVSFGMKRIDVEFDPQKADRTAVLAALSRMGFEAKAPRAAKGDEHDHEGEHDHAHGGLFGERSELIFSLVCGALAGIGWLLARQVPGPASTIVYVAAYLFGGWFTIQEAAVALRGRRFEIDFLMLVAAGGAAALGEWFEGALLLFLFSLGHSLEGFAMSRARRAIEALAKLAPKTALRLLPDGVEEEVDVASLRKGDEVVVRPNTSIPADGVVISGTSAVNQAPITGESMPVDKRPAKDVAAAFKAPEKAPAESRVFAGTINGAGALKLVVTKPAGDSTIARVVAMVTQAEAQKAPSQVFTDRFERYFVPFILLLVGVLLFAWVVVDEPFSASFYRAMAVLVAASPCALAIATPSAVLAGVARAARSGVLVKGGAHLEALGTVQAIAFDKTGTLTEGQPRLTDIVPARGIAQDQLLATALAVEKHSDHPLARAIVGGASSRQNLRELKATEVEAIIGFGVQAQVDGAKVVIGKVGLFERDKVMLPHEVLSAAQGLQKTGRTVMVVRAADTFLGVLGVMDTPRESARAVVARLAQLGVRKTIMLSGDNQQVAESVANEVGITEARGDLLPEQKVDLIRTLAASEERVAMVGDGVNDAPAMANATVGIAMGASGSDVALETADIALMADDLHALPFAVGLSRATRRIIRQNLFASLGMVAVLIPATISGLAGIGIAVGLHEGSTLLVVANALRLLAYRADYLNRGACDRTLSRRRPLGERGARRVDGGRCRRPREPPSSPLQ